MPSTFLQSFKRRLVLAALTAVSAAAALGVSTPAAALNLSQTPLFLTDGQAPLVLLTMARDHKLYFEAYNDYSDLDGDGELDVGYKPAMTYYGYFDSNKCYDYVSSPTTGPARFVPASVTMNKQCAGNWSGDFLNYVTTSRIDALRKVLYGGSRAGADTKSLTVLERTYIPQEGHSWGKEYSPDRDSYDISKYTPYSKPGKGYSHIFASTSLSSDQATPLLRVLNNTRYRVWEWLSIERPVVGSGCAIGGNYRVSCAVSDWEIVPPQVLSGVTQTIYDTKNYGTGAPNNASEFTNMVNNYAKSSTLCGSRSITMFYGNGNPFRVAPCNTTNNDNYLNIMTSTITVPDDGYYDFAVDGDDAIDVLIQISGTWYTVAGYYGIHGTSNNYNYHGVTAKKLEGGKSYNIVVRHQQGTGGESYALYWKRTEPNSIIKDFNTRVEVCNKDKGLESNCQAYTYNNVTSYKPVGLLQKQGANNAMYFGLLSGSYTHNTQGGVLRKGISSISNEITPDGRFGAYGVGGEKCGSVGALVDCVNGIISTINKFKITGFNGDSYDTNCGWISTRAINDGECAMWGNPIGEMVYEGLRYFAGKTGPTAAFSYSATNSALVDNSLGLPIVTSWTNPYSDNPAPTAASPTFAACAKPYSLLISDVYPSFDSDTVPGSSFNTFAGDIPGMNVTTLSQTMWDKEFGGSKNIFIGRSGTNDTGTPTSKSVSTFGNIRGLAPGEPTREGSYYSAAAAYYGHITDLNAVAGSQKLSTYSVALAAPLPNIDIPVGGSKVTFMPFAKSVAGSGIVTNGTFQPTNQIVDFYIDTIRNTAGTEQDNNINGGRPYYKFRINYEDQEQGADYDMDAIGLYEVKLNANNTVTISISSDYAAGSIIQHMGFAISGTTNDGAYLTVRDSDTAAGGDVTYKLDCRSNSTNPANCGTTGTLPLYKELTFTPSSTGSTSLLKDPLWYAAKWGSFSNADGRTIPETSDWDSTGTGTPDNYFLVTNPLTLETQLTKAFAQISKQSATAAATSTNSFSYQTTSALYQARFNSDGWGGELQAFPISTNGTLGDALWQADKLLASMAASDRTILTYDPDAAAGSRAIAFRWAKMTVNGTLRNALNQTYNGTADSSGSSRLSYLRGGIDSSMRTRPVITGTSLTNKLGDIVSSQPQYVTYPSAGFADDSYVGFRTDYLAREAMVYVGANDGMMHGFSAVDGKEKLAYVPSQMYRNRLSQALLPKLTAPNYGQLDNPHRYYVDGTIATADICAVNCLAKTDWKTIAVGGLNAGGQGIYALNITDPSLFSETNPAKTVMWEFNDRDDVDTDPDMQYGLGYTFSQPAIVRICTARVASSTTVPKACTAGRWVVIFGNGYNATEADGYPSSATTGKGFAILYVLDANTGAVIKKINTKVGTNAAPNGLASTAPVDVDNDGYIDYVYAGDLQGNMWKFDVSDATAGNWGSAFNAGGVPVPFYTAKNASGGVLPITTAPDALIHPDGGVQVVFGTGSYITVPDKFSTDKNTLFGLRDVNVAIASTNLSNLQSQSITVGTSVQDDTSYRSVSANTMSASAKGWYLTLPDLGERVAYDPRVIGKVLAFTSTVPSASACDYGGSGWDYYVDALSGGNLGYNVFTSLGATKLTYTLANAANTTGFASARQSNVGITPNGTLITQGKGVGTVILSGSTGNSESYNIDLGQNISGRVSWREIITD